MSDLPEPLATIRREVDAHLERAMRRLAPRVGRLHPLLDDVADELLGAVLAGGKRLRPMLLLLGHRAAGGDDEAAMGPAMGLELLHTCALLHDDVIDGAPTRRGRAAAHRAFAAMHRRRGWRGTPEAFGVAAAILLGDLAFVHADELFLTAQTPPDRLLAAFGVFTRLREEVMAGQYLDVAASQSDGVDRQTALEIARLKSGRYSIARPLEVGAVLGGGDDALVERLLRYGEPLGLAFQLTDDLLGVLGEEADTGKSTASDLEEGKRTLLVAETLQRLPVVERDRFQSLLGAPDLDESGAAWLRDRMRTSGAVASVRDEVTRAVAASRAALVDPAVDGPVTAALDALAVYVGGRRL